MEQVEEMLEGFEYGHDHIRLTSKASIKLPGLQKATGQKQGPREEANVLQYLAREYSGSDPGDG